MCIRNSFNKIKKKKIQKDFITLHVGAGTFKPVKTDVMKDHEMHAEYFTVSKSTIQNLVAHLDKNIIAVGTTSLRTLESLYWLGVKQSTVDSQQSMEITQWEVYDHKEKMISTKEALENLIQSMTAKDLDNLIAKTPVSYTHLTLP